MAKGDAVDTDSLPGDLFFRDGTIVLHKIHGSYSVKFSAHEQEVNCVDFQGGLIVSGSRDRTAKVSSDVPAAAAACAEVTSEVLCHECVSVSRTVVSPVLRVCRRSAGYLGVVSCLSKDACGAKLLAVLLASVAGLN